MLIFVLFVYTVLVGQEKGYQRYALRSYGSRWLAFRGTVDRDLPLFCASWRSAVHDWGSQRPKARGGVEHAWVVVAASVV